jgi:putative nucleotidyltransferase with HDIG domain
MEESKRLEQLYQLTIVIGTTLDLAHETAAFTEWLMQTVEPTLAALFITDEAKQELQLMGACGFEPPAEPRLPMGLNLWRWLAEQGVSVPEEGDPRRYAVPISIEGQLFGTLCLVSNHPPEQLAEEQRLVSTAAGYLAPVLRNIWRYQTLEQQVAERTAALQQEIAERKRAEEALRESEAELSAIFHNAPVLMVLVDRERRVRKVNRVAVEFAGRSAEEMIGLRGGEALRCLHSLDDPKGCGFGPFCEICVVRRTVLDTFETGDSHYRVEAKLPFVREQKQEELTLLVSTTLLSVSEGERVLVCIEDITERKRAQEELQKSYVQLRRTLEGTVNVLVSAIEMRDPYTAGHQRRVTHLACAIAREMGLPKERIEGLRMAGLIHDIGKISVPAEVLSKPGPLNDLEYGLIKNHPQVGHDVLKGIDFPWPVAQIVLQHHERMDGSGYPQGLSGKEIILEARILAVADVVEAMVSHRPYRLPRGLDKALEEILQNRGVLYDAEVVDICLKLFTEKGFKFE